MKQGAEQPISLFECLAVVTALAFQLAALAALIGRPLAS